MSETWVWNERPNFDNRYVFDNISFTSNDKYYTSIKIYTSALMKMDYDDDMAYNLEAETWYNEAYRTITFLTAPKGDLLTLLQANAVKQSYVGIGLKNLSSYNQDLSIPRKKDLDVKQNIITGGASTITSSNLSRSMALISDANGKVNTSKVTARELNFLDGATSNVQTQLNNKVPTTRTVNNKALSSNITLTASDVDAIAAKDGTGTGMTKLEGLQVTNGVEIGYNNELGGGLYGNGTININAPMVDNNNSAFTLHASGQNNTANKMNMYSDRTTIELSDNSGTRGLVIHAPDSQSGLDEDGMIIDGLARIAPEAAGTTYRSAPLTGGFYTDIIKPYSLPSVNTTNNLDMLMVVNGNWQTDHDTAGIQNASSLIVNKWPDNVTIVLRSFRRWGKLCLFTVQLNVTTQISTNYGFTLLEMPYTSIDRVWINNQTRFYMNSADVAVQVNNSNLATGNYILTGFYLTTDNARVV